MVPNRLRSGSDVHSLLIVVLLVVATAVAAVAILTQVEHTANSRLSDGAASFRGSP